MFNPSKSVVAIGEKIPYIKHLTEQHMNEIEHIFLDMDGVLSNFVGGVSSLFNQDITKHNAWGIWDELGVTSKEFWTTIQNKQMFWADLEPYPWARDLVNVCLEKTKGNVTLLTSPSLDPKCYAEKVVWVRRHFPTMIRKLMIGPEKHLLAKPTTLLIDDSDDNCRKFKEAGGQVILFPQTWNATNTEKWEHVDTSDKLKHVKTAMDNIDIFKDVSNQTSYNK